MGNGGLGVNVADRGRGSEQGTADIERDGGDLRVWRQGVEGARRVTPVAQVVSPDSIR